MNTNTPRTSQTPHTDAAEHELFYTWNGATMRKCRDGGWVEADFARELERELAQVTARKDWLVAHSAYIAHARDEEVCWVMMRLDEESDYEAVGKPHYTADEAIDAVLNQPWGGHWSFLPSCRKARAAYRALVKETSS